MYVGLRRAEQTARNADFTATSQPRHSSWKAKVRPARRPPHHLWAGHPYMSLDSRRERPLSQHTRPSPAVTIEEAAVASSNTLKEANSMMAGASKPPRIRQTRMCKTTSRNAMPSRTLSMGATRSGRRLLPSCATALACGLKQVAMPSHTWTTCIRGVRTPKRGTRRESTQAGTRGIPRKSTNVLCMFAATWTDAAAAKCIRRQGSNAMQDKSDVFTA
mmetsp:Transcript_45074/g.119102  ORF Transcript_45074/g.119102 Transcript_45074/m.119102 type:complete len:218 (+) Transcript_45074:590-1243(+)